MAHGVSSADLWRVAVRVAVAALALGAALWLAVALRGVLELVFGGVVLSAGLGPLVRRLGRLRIPRAPAALLILLALGAAAAGFLALALPPTIAEAEALLRRAPAVGDGMVAGARALQERFPLLPPIETQFAGLAQALGSQLGAFAAQALGVARVALGVVDGLLSLLVLLLVTLYLVVDGDRVREYLLSFWPTERETWLRGVADRVGQRLSGWLAGQVALSAAVGLLSFAGLALLGVDGALLLALVAAAGEVVPIVGPILSAVPAVLAAAVQDPLKGLAVAVLYLLIQQVENNLLVPRIMGRATALHPLAVVLALLIGGELLGVAGTLLAVPAAAVLSVVLDEVRTDLRARRRRLAIKNGQERRASCALQGRAGGSRRTLIGARVRRP
ncbi:MAG TPA: AI-2E family transporter [Chloroflexota bacterium]|nr:AI-2E family transporter [Chloroflexota bacterium]